MDIRTINGKISRRVDGTLKKVIKNGKYISELELLRKVISSLGYNADDFKANKKAHDNLPSCCQHL